MNTVDVIIIGSGIAGLYAAYQIKRLAPANTTFLILEKNPKKWMGGRAGNEMFYGADVVVGAGVGRKRKDHALIKLLKDTKTHYSEFESTRNYAQSPTAMFTPVDIMHVMRTLKAEYKKHPTQHQDKTFKQFFIDILGNDSYKEFVLTTGYTDFENADIYETLYHYGMDDNVSGWTALHIPWNELTERLYQEIGGGHFRFSTEVVKIEPTTTTAASRFNITTTTNKTYHANKVIVATTIQVVTKILPGASAPTSLYQQIHGQPFLIVYAKFDRASTEIMKKYVQTFTVVPGPLQKMIPMDPDKGVYMIAYTDNQHAKFLKAKGALENTPESREMYSKWIQNALGIPKETPPLNITAIRDYYWNDGTHYYTPLNSREYKNRIDFIRKAQNPMKGMVVVGEMISRHQGWAEGALESVDAVITSAWVNTIH
jgi:phytoene dehydrogenase-like protein